MVKTLNSRCNGIKPKLRNVAYTRGPESNIKNRTHLYLLVVHGASGLLLRLLLRWLLLLLLLLRGVLGRGGLHDGGGGGGWLLLEGLHCLLLLLLGRRLLLRSRLGLHLLRVLLVRLVFEENGMKRMKRMKMKKIYETRRLSL